MADGSEEICVVIGVATPSHVMANGAHESAEADFRTWVASIHPAFAESNLADRLVLEGYDRLDSVHAFDVAKLVNEYDLKEGHAVQFVRAVEQRNKTLAQIDAVKNGSSASTHRKKRTQAPKIPIAAKGSQGCGVAGLGDVASVRAWLTQLMSWARSDFTTAEARAIESIALDPASHPYHAEGSIDPEFEAVLHYALLQDLPAATIQFLGVAATEPSGLKVLQVLMQPVLGAKGHTSTQQAILHFEEYLPCKSRSVLLEWTQGFEQLCTLLASVEEPVSQARKEAGLDLLLFFLN